MEKKKDYNYLIELFNEWRKCEDGNMFISIGKETIDIRKDGDIATFRVIDFTSFEKAIKWLEEQLQPTYEDALKFISDNEDKEAEYYVYYSANMKEWVCCVWHSFTPFIKYMTEEKCKEFIEKFKNVKPKA